MTTAWFEDELSLPERDLEDVAKVLSKQLKGDEREITADIRREARGSVLVFKPDWQEFIPDSGHRLLSSGVKKRFFMTRLLFEFEIPKENYAKGVRFTYAKCEAHLCASSGGSHPETYDLFPKDLYEGEAQKVTVKFGPEIGIDKVGSASLGSIEADIHLGQLTPVIVGYFGFEKREPYWEIRPQTKALLGIQCLWLVISMPASCPGTQLAVMASADIQTTVGRIHIGPKETDWDNRPSILIE